MVITISSYQTANKLVGTVLVTVRLNRSLCKAIIIDSRVSWRAQSLSMDIITNLVISTARTSSIRDRTTSSRSAMISQSSNHRALASLREEDATNRSK